MCKAQAVADVDAQLLFPNCEDTNCDKSPRHHAPAELSDRATHALSALTGLLCEPAPLLLGKVQQLLHLLAMLPLLCLPLAGPLSGQELGWTCQSEMHQ